MKPYNEAMYWRTNPKWYKANYETDKYELTPLAPPRAVESFRLWKRQQKWRKVRDFYEKLLFFR